MDTMKKYLIGTTLAFFGLFADIGILIFGAIVGSALTEWQTNLGKVWTAISDNYLLIPFILATAVMVLGVVLLIKDYFSDKS